MNLPVAHYVDMIRNAPIESLCDREYLTDLICRVGLENSPACKKLFTGKGLFLYQLPWQFAGYLLELKDKKISSYLEIGAWKLGTFIFTVEYLNRFHAVTNAVAVDPNKPAVFDEYMKLRPGISYRKEKSTSPDFKAFIDKNKFDLVLIDGDHNIHVAWSDYRLCRNSSRILVMHDICHGNCSGVAYVWVRMKAVNPGCRAVEFLEQEPDRANLDDAYCGIGVLYPTPHPA